MPTVAEQNLTLLTDFYELTMGKVEACSYSMATHGRQYCPDNSSIFFGNLTFSIGGLLQDEVESIKTAANDSSCSVSFDAFIIFIFFICNESRVINRISSFVFYLFTKS